MPDRLTTIIFYFLLTVQLIFALLSWYIIRLEGQDGSVMMSGFLADLYLPALIIILTGGVAYFIDNSRSNQAKRFGYTTETGQMHYRTTVLLRCAIVQSGNLLALSMAVTTQRMDVLALVGAGLLMYMFFRPSGQQYLERYG